MHHIYLTKSIVISNSEIGDADKNIVLLTKDFGLIRAKALGIRKLVSKLRFSLQPYSIVEVAIVRGKTGYRITNAKLENNFFYKKKDDCFVKSMSRIFSLIERLIQGEEMNKNIFASVYDSINFYLDKDLKKTDIEILEIITVIKILFELGYFDKKEDMKDIIESKISEKQIVFFLEDKNKKNAIDKINLAINQSQL